MNGKKIKLNPGQCCCGPAPNACEILGELREQLKERLPHISDEQLDAYVYDQILTRTYPELMDAVEAWNCGNTAGAYGILTVIYDKIFNDLLKSSTPAYEDPEKWWIGGGPDLVLNGGSYFDGSHGRQFLTSFDEDGKIVVPLGTETSGWYSSTGWGHETEYNALVGTWSKCGAAGPNMWIARPGAVIPYEGIIFSNPRLITPATYNASWQIIQLYGGPTINNNRFYCDVSVILRKDIPYDQNALLNSPTIGTVETILERVKADVFGIYSNFSNALIPDTRDVYGDDGYPLEDDDGNYIYETYYDWDKYYLFPEEAKKVVKEFHGNDIIIEAAHFESMVGLTNQQPDLTIEASFDKENGNVHLVYNGDDDVTTVPMQFGLTCTASMYDGPTTYRGMLDFGPYYPTAIARTEEEAQAICARKDAEGLQILQMMCSWSPEQQMYANGDCGSMLLQGLAFYRKPDVEENGCAGGE